MASALEVYKAKALGAGMAAKNAQTTRVFVRTAVTGVSAYGLGRAEAKVEGATKMALGGAIATRLFVDDPLVQAAAEGVIDSSIAVLAYQKGLLDSVE